LIQFLVAIAFFIMVAVFNWFKRRQAEAESEREQPPSTQPPPPMRHTRETPPPAPVSPRIPTETAWERELRRLMEPEAKQLPPRGGPAHEPPPLTHTVSTAGAERRPPQTWVAPATVRPTTPPVQIRPVRSEEDLGLPVELPGLISSGESYARASELDTRVADRLRNISQRVALHAPEAQAQQATFERNQAVALLRNRSSLRAVIMASVVLGPPRAMQD
jgi:hypothetical protein